MKTLYSNGKILLTAEYLVLDGAKAIAIPTKFGQSLTVEANLSNLLIWESLSKSGNCWFKAVFELPRIRLIESDFDSQKEQGNEFIAEKLQCLLREAQKLNPDFLNNQKGYDVKTELTFDRNWGLGSSSTLINNVADWADVNSYHLLWNTFAGSGYDIACAKIQTPIFYQKKDKSYIVQKTNFKTNFLDELFFVHLNKKQNTAQGIAHYKKNNQNVKNQIAEISKLSEEFINASCIKDLEKIIITHEKIISSIIKQTPVKHKLFTDYFGQVKSLGAWGGDFVLATGTEDTPKYFKNKGFKTVIKYQDMAL